MLIVRQKMADPSVLSVDTMYKTFMMLFTIMMEGNKQAYCKGYVILSDQEGTALRHALIITPTLLRKHMAVFQDSYPMDNQTLINNSRLFIIHMPSLLEKFLTMFRAALDEKYQNILRILPKSDIEQTFKDEVGEEILPEEYGGTNGTIEEHVEFWKQEVPRHSEFLAEQTRLRSDESLRPGKPKTAAELFGSCSIM